MLMGVHEAQARRGFILITHGDAVSELGPARLEGELAAIPELQGAKIGFHYDYFGLFWLDLWNWGGEYVIYNSAKQGEVLTAKQAAAFLGVPESEMGTPLNYKAPFGLDILLGIGLLKYWSRKSQNTRVFAPARTETTRPRWTPSPSRSNSDPPRLTLSFPASNGPPPMPPPLPPEQS
jgi:hypothetical protein